MKFSIIAAVLAATSAVEAHTHVWSIWVNGQDQGDGRNSYIRSPPNNNPVKDINQGAIKCNVNDRRLNNWVNAKAGDTLTFEWYHNSRGDMIIDASHKGPVLAYIADANNENSWTKIAQDGLNNGQWAVDKLINDRGKQQVRIPSNLKAGDYIIRTEIIALHEGESSYQSNPLRGAQFYPSCSQVRITQGGSATLPGGVSFPGTYNFQDPGILFNIYTKPPPTYYPIPGGNVWQG